MRPIRSIYIRSPTGGDRAPFVSSLCRRCSIGSEKDGSRWNPVLGMDTDRVPNRRRHLQGFYPRKGSPSFGCNLPAGGIGGRPTIRAHSTHESGDRREAACGGNAGDRYIAAMTPGMGLQFSVLTDKTEMNGSRETAPTQHQQRRERLLQADGAERDMPCGAPNGATDEFRFRRSDAAVAGFALGYAEKPQGARKRQQPERYSHDQKIEDCLHGAAFLGHRQRSKSAELRHQASLTTSCSNLRPHRVCS